MAPRTKAQDAAAAEAADESKERPSGDEAKGYPDNGRNRTNVILEKGMPEEEQRVDRTHDKLKGETS